MSEAAKRVRVLYVVYWGALEPLGRSLVVPAVIRLASMGLDLTLITFEKPTDLEDTLAVRKLRAALEAAGVRWCPLRYHKTPKWPAKVFDSCLAVLYAIRLRIGGRFDVVHARTFVAGPMGFVISRLLGARFVYHNEGFYPDEQVDGGVWKQDSTAHRFSRRVEAFMYDRADAIIALSERARSVLLGRQDSGREPVPVIVVPSAVDLTVFQPSTELRPPDRALSLVYLGSIGLRYRLGDAGLFVGALRRVEPRATLTVVSVANRQLIESILDSSGLPRDAWTVKALAHADVPAELRLHDGGLSFLTEGLSEPGCSPTKVGEYWACGLPVITTANVGDIAAIVEARKVGVVVRGRDSRALDTAALELVRLLRNPDLRSACRAAAEAAYSLEAACARQKRLYAELT